MSKSIERRIAMMTAAKRGGVIMGRTRATRTRSLTTHLSKRTGSN